MQRSGFRKAHRWGGLLLLTGAVALLVASALAAASLYFHAVGRPKQQLLLADIALQVLAYASLVASGGLIIAVYKTLRSPRASQMRGLIFVVAASLCALCWLIMGMRQLFWPRFFSSMIDSQ